MLKKILSSFAAFLLLAQSAPAVDYAKEQALQGPKWIGDGVVYSVFTRDFSSEGTLNGVTEKLENIKNLGATIIWLMPIQPIGQQSKKGAIGSPYAIRDYYEVNPDYGNKQDLKNLVSRAHQLGLKVILDAVVNHTSWDSALMKKPKFYKHDANGRIMPPMPEWSDVAALDYDNQEVRVYILDMLKYWLKEFDIDGYRFDAASLVPMDFWKEVRRELLRVKTDIMLLGEEDLPEGLAVAFDVDYAWDFEKALNDVMTNGAPATETLQTVLKKEKSTFPRGSLHMRFSDNHDKKRAIARFSEKGALAASALIFTLDGVPLIYNGMEVGDTSESTDPALFEKIPIFWETAQMRPEFASFYPLIIALRKQHPALRTGDMLWLKNSDESRIAAYVRKNKEEEFLIAINFSNRPFEGTIETDDRKYQDLTPSLTSTTIKDDTTAFPALSLKPFEFRIYMKLPE